MTLHTQLRGKKRLGGMGRRALTSSLIDIVDIDAGRRRKGSATTQQRQRDDAAIPSAGAEFDGDEARQQAREGIPDGSPLRGSLRSSRGQIGPAESHERGEGEKCLVLGAKAT